MDRIVIVKQSAAQPTYSEYHNLQSTLKHVQTTKFMFKQNSHPSEIIKVSCYEEVNEQVERMLSGRAVWDATAKVLPSNTLRKAAPTRRFPASKRDLRNVRTHFETPSKVLRVSSTTILAVSAR